MTLTDELKILDDKIKSNQVQYDLSREAAKISALSSKDLLEKYEYLTCEDYGTDLEDLKKLSLSNLHWVRFWLITLRIKRMQIKCIAKKSKANIWHIIHRIVLQSLRILMNLKNYHLTLCTKN